MTETIAAEPAIPEKDPPTTAGMTTKVVKGSLWTLAGQVAPLAFSLVATPFTIRLLGAEGYGVLVLVGLIPTYLGFADFGMSLVSTKFASEAYAKGDAEHEARAVRTAALIALLASLPFGIAIFALSGWLSSMFNVPVHLVSEASLAIKIASVTFIVNFLNGIFNTPQLTRLRMDLNTLVTAGFRILGIVATPLVIYFGGGLVGALSVLLAASVATLGAHIYMSGRLLNQLFDLTVDLPLVQPMLRFGGALVATGIAGVILINAEKGIVAASISVTALAYYSVAATLANMMVLVSNTMVQSLVPAFAQLNAERTHLEALFSQILKMILVGIAPAATFFFVASKDLIRLWAGNDFSAESTLPFRLLLAGLIFSVPGYVPYSLLMARGRADVIGKLYWAEILPYLFVVLLLTYQFGIIGTAAAWGFRVAFDGVVFFLLARRTGPTGTIRSAINWKLYLAAVATLVPALVASASESVGPVIRYGALAGVLVLYSAVILRYVVNEAELAWFRSRVNAWI